MIHSAIQALEHQDVVAVEETDLIEKDAEVHTRDKQNFGSKSLFKETKWKLFCHNYPGTTERKNCVTFFFKFLLSSPSVIFTFL